MPRKRKYSKSNPDLARRRLGDLQRSLQNVANSTRPDVELPVERDLARWASDGIAAYLCDDSDLENALGLKRRGRPRKPASSDEIDLGKEILILREIRGLSWPEVTETLDPSGSGDYDESSLRGFWERVRPDVVKDYVRRMNS